MEGGEISRERGQAAIDLFDRLEAEYRGQLGYGDAARLAAVDTLAQLRRENIERRRQVLLQTRAVEAIKHNFTNFQAVTKGYQRGGDYGTAMLAHLEDFHGAGFSNVEGRRKAVLGRAHGKIDKLLARHKLGLASERRDKAGLRALVREAFGEDSGNAAAKELAEAWAEVAEWLRQRRNRAGGQTAKLEGWGLPQAHDTLAVRKVSFEKWRDFTLPKLALDRMIDPMTGRAYSSGRLELALREAFEEIRTDGFHSMQPSGGAGGRALANRRGEHRFLMFKDADSWMAYQKQFGAADSFSAMMAHIEGMARDIALMEILGPNPAATMRWMEGMALKQAALRDAAAGGGKHLDRARGKTKTAMHVFEAITGTANEPVNMGLARSMAGVRNVLVSAQLGSAAISALTDLNFSRMAAAHAGLPQAKVLARHLKLLVPGVKEDRMVAVRLGLIAEEWSAMAASQARYIGEVNGPEISKRVADVILRWSGLSPWTQSGRWAFGMEFLGFLADMRAKGFDELNPALRSTLEKYGIGRGSWDVVRATAPYEYKGATFLRPEDIAARTDIEPTLGDTLATRVLEMVQTETEFAIPSSSLRGRALFTGGLPPGTIIGEAVRSAAMYKNFAVTLFFTHIMRGVLRRGAFAKGRYFSNLVISSTLMGALSLQLKEMVKGRDPRDMFEDPGAFWGAAMIQGGGLGIFGDFLFSDVNRFGGGLPHTLAGPVITFADDVRRLTIGNALQLAGEDDTNAGRELVNFLKRYTPGGSVWYARLGYERLMLDELQRWVDPHAESNFRRRERARRRQHGQRYFWRAGSRAPQRGPDLSAAFTGL
jgi:hypothetical protein